MPAVVEELWDVSSSSELGRRLAKNKGDGLKSIALADFIFIIGKTVDSKSLF